jgi:hypothetical protein
MKNETIPLRGCCVGISQPLVYLQFPYFPAWADAAKPWNFLAVNSGGQGVAVFDSWRCGAWNRRKIFPDFDE